MARLVSEELDFNFPIDNRNDKISSEQAIDSVLCNFFQEDISPPNYLSDMTSLLSFIHENTQDKYNFPPS